MNVSAVLDKLGIKYIERGGKLSACCPFHSEKTPSFSVYSSTGNYICFGCGKKGSLNSLVLEKTGKNLYDYMGSGYEYIPTLKPYEEKQLKNTDFEVEGILQDINEDKRVRDYCWSIGLTNSFIDFFNVKFSKHIKINQKGTLDKDKKEYWNRLIIPCIYNNHIYNYEMRDFTKRSGKKVLYPIGSESDILFNYDNLNLDETVYIVEGIKGLSKVWSYYSTNVISTFGKVIKENQKKLINKLPHICIIPDNDENKIDKATGEPVNNIKIMTDIYDDFYQYEYEVAYIPFKGKDTNDLSRTQLKKVIDNRKFYKDIIVEQSGLFKGSKISNELYLALV